MLLNLGDKARAYLARYASYSMFFEIKELVDREANFTKHPLYSLGFNVPWSFSHVTLIEL